MSAYLGNVRFEEDGKILIRVHGFFKHGPDAITAVFRDSKKYQAEASLEEEDAFVQKLYRKLKRRERWKSLLAFIIQPRKTHDHN